MVNLKIPQETAILQINGILDEIKTIKLDQNGLEYYDLVRWCSKTWAVIDGIYEAGDIHPEEIRTIGLSNCSCNSQVAALILAEAYHSRLLAYINEIQDSMKAPE